MATDFCPEKYGMIFCPSCLSKGYTSGSQDIRKVCGMCGGFGLIKKERFGYKENQIIELAKNQLFAHSFSQL